MNKSEEIFKKISETCRQLKLGVVTLDEEIGEKLARLWEQYLETLPEEDRNDIYYLIWRGTERIIKKSELPDLLRTSQLIRELFIEVMS